MLQCQWPRIFLSIYNAYTWLTRTYCMKGTYGFVGYSADSKLIENRGSIDVGSNTRHEIATNPKILSNIIPGYRKTMSHGRNRTFNTISSK